MPNFKKQNLYLLSAFCTIMSFAACHTYYKAINLPAANNNGKTAAIDSLNLQARYFILRNGSQAYYMENISFSADQKTLYCILDTLSPDHKLHLTNGRKGKMQYQKSTITDLNVLNEVHFYITPDTVPKFGKYTLDFNKVQKIEVIEKDKKRTTGSYVLGGLIITPVIILITAAMAGISSTLFTFHPF